MEGWQNLADREMNSATGTHYNISTVRYPGMFETIIAEHRGLFGGASRVKNWRWVRHAFDPATARQNHQEALKLAMIEPPNTWTLSPHDIKNQRETAIDRAMS